MSKHASTDSFDVFNMTGAEWKEILESEDVITIPFETANTLLHSKYKSVKPAEAIHLYLIFKFDLEFFPQSATITILAKQLKISKDKVMKGIKELVILGILDENEVPYEA